MAEEEGVLKIRVTLRGKIKDQFLQIKRVEDRTDEEVVRLLITDYFEKKLAKGARSSAGCMHVSL